MLGGQPHRLVVGETSRSTRSTGPSTIVATALLKEVVMSKPFRALTWSRDAYEALVSAVRSGEPTVTIKLDRRTEVTFLRDDAEELVQDLANDFATPMPVFPENKEGDEP